MENAKVQKRQSHTIKSFLFYVLGVFGVLLCAQDISGLDYLSGGWWLAYFVTRGPIIVWMSLLSVRLYGK